MKKVLFIALFLTCIFFIRTGVASARPPCEEEQLYHIDYVSVPGGEYEECLDVCLFGDGTGVADSNCIGGTLSLTQEKLGADGKNLVGVYATGGACHFKLRGGRHKLITVDCIAPGGAAVAHGTGKSVDGCACPGS
jgi:hypothetical protein